MVAVTVLAGVVPATVGASDHSTEVTYEFDDLSDGESVAEYNERLTFVGEDVVARVAGNNNHYITTAAGNQPIEFAFDEPQEVVKFRVGAEGNPSAFAAFDITAYDSNDNPVDTSTPDISMGVEPWRDVTLATSGERLITRVVVTSTGSLSLCLPFSGCGVYPVPTTNRIDSLVFDAYEPTVAIRVDSTTVGIDDAISFDASVDTAGRIVSYQWNFAGEPMSGSSVAHTFRTAGSKTVTLTVTDEAGNTATDTLVLTVAGAVVPSFQFGPDTPNVEQTVQFDASGTQADGAISSYEWDFGDGSAPRTTSSVFFPYTYGEPGTYTVSLTVTDRFGQEASVERQIEVNGPPGGDIQLSAAEPEAGDRVTFDASGSTDESVASLQYAWDFGDGSDPLPNPQVTHVYDEPGTYTVSLTVTDERGLSSTVSQQVTVLPGPTPPTAAFTVPSGELTVNSQLEFDASRSQDTDGQIVAYRWDFGDGSDWATTGPRGAQASHQYAQPGPYTVTLTVVDDDGLTATTSRDINVASTGFGVSMEAVAGLIGLLLLLVLAYLGYRWYAGREKAPAEPVADPEPEPEPEEELWQDIVIDEVEAKRGRKYLTLRNTSDRTWDLSNATILDDDGQQFTFRDGLSIPAGETERFPVDEEMDITPGQLVHLETQSGDRYDLPWRDFLGGRGSGG